MKDSEPSLKDQLFVLDGGMEAETNPDSETETETKALAEVPEGDSSVQVEQPTPSDMVSSRTLLALPQNQLKTLLDSDCACATCPSGMWLTKGDAVLCFCGLMKTVSSTMSEDGVMPVLLCDGLFLT